MLNFRDNHKLLLLPILAFLLTFSACKDKQSNTQEVVSDTTKKTNMDQKPTDSTKKTILCFGNSLTAGYGLELEQAWPALLQDRLDSLGYDYQVINAGLSGETSSGGLNRIEWVLREKVDIFILELGANDMLRGLDVSSTKANLDSILTIVKEKYADCHLVLAGMKSPPNMGPSYEKAFNKIYTELAQKHNAVLIPFFLDSVAGNERLNLPDGKHPNAEGQKQVLENVWQHIQAVID